MGRRRAPMMKFTFRGPKGRIHWVIARKGETYSSGHYFEGVENDSSGIGTVRQLYLSSDWILENVKEI